MESTADRSWETEIEASPTPAGAAPAEARDGSAPPPADGGAHPDHRAADPATDAPSATPPPAAGAPSHPRRRWLLWAGAVAGLAVGGYLLVPAVETVLNTVSTDDAYVNGYVTLVAPRVPGQVARVLVHDNYRVKKGDLLVQLDREPYQVQVDIKKAAVVSAEADLKAARGPGPGHPGPGRQPAVETPEVDRRCRRLGRAAPGPGRGPAEQGGDLRSRMRRPAAGPGPLQPQRDLPRGLRPAPARPSGRPKPRSSRPSKKSMRRGSPSACRRAPRRES